MIYLHVGSHTFAVLNAQEDYESLSSGMKEVLNDINALIAKSTIAIDTTSESYCPEIVLSCDYKVMKNPYNFRYIINKCFHDNAVSTSDAWIESSSFRLCLHMVTVSLITGY